MELRLLLVVAFLTTVPDASFSLQDPLNWYKHTSIYQIYPISFKDSNGDGIGDLRGIISKLDYLKELGVGAIWLNPFYESPLEGYGYDITNYIEVDPVFGTLDDFYELVAKLKELDIKLIVDIVPNHTSNRHPWFQRSIQRIEPYTDYYVWHDGKINENGERVPPNNWIATINGPMWEWNEQRQQYYLHQFGANMPDLNYRNPAVHEEMKIVFKIWAERGVDGFRIDAMNHMLEDAQLRDEPLNPQTGFPSWDYNYLIHDYTTGQPESYDLIKEWRSFLDNEYTNKDGHTRILITEVYASAEKTMEYFGNSTNPGAHYPFNFNLFSTLYDYTKPWDYYNAIHNWVDHLPEGMASNWVTGNHDQIRISARAGSRMIDAMNMLVTLLPGTNIIYYGEEIGMEDNSGKDSMRGGYQWDNTQYAGFSTHEPVIYPVNENYHDLNLVKEQQDSRSHYHVFQTLLQLKETPAIKEGQLNTFVMESNVFSFTRELDGSDRVLVLINVGEETQTVDPKPVFPFFSDTLHVVTSSIFSKYQPGTDIPNKSITLDPKEALVLKSY